MIFSRIVAGVLAAFAVGAAAEVPEYFRAGISGVFPEAKQYREVREKEFSIHDDAGKVLGRLFLESIDDTERRFGYAGTVEVALLFDGENRVAGVLIGKNAETRRYLEALAALNRSAAALADGVYEVVCGIPICHRKEEGL